jgi:hypothetical protein
MTKVYLIERRVSKKADWVLFRSLAAAYSD